MLRGATLAGSLAALWLLLSGYYIPLILTFGAISVAVTVFLVRRMSGTDDETVPTGLVTAIWRFWPWLGKEIVKSNIAVAKIVLSPKMDISPTVIRFKPTQRTPVGLVTHANAITLTPGTVTVEIDDDGTFVIHALTREMADGVAAPDASGHRVEGEMGARVTAVEG